MDAGDDRKDAPSEDEAEAEGGARVTRRDVLAYAAGTIVATALGCSPDAPMPGGDAGASPDAAASGDSGSLVDASAEPDAGPPVEPPETTDESLASFPAAVAAGEATPSSALFWTLYAGSAPLELVVWRMEGDAYGPVVHRGPVTPGDGGYVRADVGTLSAGARHRFAFFELDASGARVARSAIGRVRAAIADDALEPLRFGAVSCISQRRPIATIGHAGGRDDLDAFLFLGDFVYTDDTADGMIAATTLAQYRDKYRLNTDRPEMRALRASTGTIATWDDHEFDNDLDPERLDPARRAAAVQAFFDHQPVRRDDAFPERIWKSLRWGRTAEIFVLDCRLERLPSTRRSASAQYVGRAQMDWLKAGLVASSATFKLILSSVPISDFPGVFDVQQGDRWEGYDAQRREILQHVEDRAIPGVLWVSGDFHLASAQRLAPSGLGSTQREILVGPGAQSGNVLAGTLGPPQFDFGSTTNNYTVLELDPGAGTVRCVWVRGDGSTLEDRTYTLA